jgi:DNA-binding transcriptional LysR family regulator
LIRQVESDHLDAAFCRLSIAKLEKVVFDPLLEEPMVAALPNGHSLVRTRAKDAIPLKHLADENFVFNRQPGSLAGIRDHVLAACHAAGFTPRVVQEAPNVIATLPLVAAGIGIAIVPASLRDMNVRGVVYRRLARSTLLRTSVSLGSRRGDSSAVVRQFVSLVRRRAKDYRDM